VELCSLLSVKITTNFNDATPFYEHAATTFSSTHQPLDADGFCVVVELVPASNCSLQDFCRAQFVCECAGGNQTVLLQKGRKPRDAGVLHIAAEVATNSGRTFHCAHRQSSAQFTLIGIGRGSARVRSAANQFLVAPAPCSATPCSFSQSSNARSSAAFRPRFNCGVTLSPQ